MNMSLDGSLIPLERESRFHRVIAFLQADAAKLCSSATPCFSTRVSQESNLSPVRSRTIVVNSWMSSYVSRICGSVSHRRLS